MDAAERQLDAAIRLFFGNEDPVAVHSLAVAAANVFADLAEQRCGGVSWRTRIRDDSGLSMKDLKALMHEEWNFFKHAERDPEATLIFSEAASEDFIFVAILDCGALSATSCTMQAFQIWYMAAHPERFCKNDRIAKDAMTTLPGLSGLNRDQQIERGAEFLEQCCGASGSRM